jgi:hypothetical protein
LSQVTCYKCGHTGHYANECPNDGPPQLTAIAETDYLPQEKDNTQPMQDEHADVSLNTDNKQIDHHLTDGDNQVETQIDRSQYTSEGKKFHLQDYEEYKDRDTALAISYLDIYSMEGHTKEAKKLQVDRILHKSTAPKPRPSLPHEATWPIVAKVNINGLDAITMIDTGSSMDAITPEFAELSNQKVFEFTDPMAIQLGCKGSQSKVHFGSEGHLSLGLINQSHYWDIVNLDKYDAIIGLPTMRKFFITVDPANGWFTINNQPFQSLTEKEEDHELAWHNAMHQANHPQSNTSAIKPAH